MIGEAFVNLILLLSQKGVLTDKEALEFLDGIIDKAAQQKAITDRMEKK